ncbi:MAG: sulfatase-like hydrolase/transferase [Polyangiaceae bacterium]|jgi:choline-sulfatase|nr:sulfatase-like hydrolase/transferase [Polyangiaceae bacterium]MBK8937324.1 sulfatase-like hydrolase/transferase [Polyangiaceae bacterium]
MSDVGTEPSLISDAAQSSQQPSSASPTPSSDPEAASPLRPSAPPPPNLRATIAEACGLALVSCLLGSIPAGLRVARAGGSFVGGLVVAAAIVLPLLAAAISMSKAAGRGFRMVTGLRVGRSTAAVIALWIGLMAPVLMVLGGLLKEKTNHRGLGGATFGVLGLFVAAGSLAVAYRLVEAARRLVERGLTPRLVAGGLAAVGVVPTVLASIPLLRGHDDSPHAPLVTAALIDGVLFIVAGAVAVTYDVGERARHAARRFGAIAAGAWLVLGALWLSLSPALAAALRTGGGLAAALVGGLERWTDRDGDGHGAHFGGRDCDEGDPRVHPGAQDVSADGVDQDCDGVDGVVVPGARPAAHAQAHVEPTPAAAQDQAPAPAPVAASKPSIVLVTLDTVRADHTSAYGYAQPTTPRLASLAAQGALFSHAYAPASDTQRALMPLFSAVPWHDTPKSNKEWPILRDEAETLAERMKAAGYRTAFVSSFTWMGREKGFGQGFDSFSEVFRDEHPERGVTGPLAVRAARAEVEKAKADPRPLFLWVHLFDAHEQYRRHDGFSFGRGDKGAYDSEIGFVDKQLGDLVDAVDASALKDNVAIIVHGSQGEGFGEHDVSGHGKELYEEMVRVPLVVRLTGAPAGLKVAGRAVSTLDIVPTILELAGAAAPAIGVSLGPALRGAALERAPVQLRNGRRASVIDYPMKLIVVRRDKKERLLLFDLAADPREERDLSSERAEDLKRLRALIEPDPTPKRD